jgi:hypothetical protein
MKHSTPNALWKWIRIRRASTAILFGLWLSFSPTAKGQDYLSPELRSAVERLKAESEATPANPGNVRQRATLLWHWLNAYSLTGQHIPVNATATLNTAMNLPESKRPGLAQLRSVDDYIHEFSVYDEQPDAIGQMEILTPGPFVVESWQELKIRYTVGSMPLEPGATILVNRHFNSDAASWQREDPAGDNYLSITASNPDTHFELTQVPWSGMHGGFRGPQPQTAYKVEGNALRTGDTIAIAYGDRSGGSRGYRVQSFSNDAVQLPIHIQFKADGVFFSVPIATYEVVGREADAVHGFVPSIVRPGEPFDVRIRAEDAYRNRATGHIPTLEVTLNGEHHITLPAGDDAIQFLRGVMLEDLGTYRFAFASSDGRIAGISGPVWVREDPDWRIYWGETHGHSGFAEGQGTPSGYLRFGRDDACLDFLTLSEHDIWMDNHEWNVLNAVSKQFTEQEKFIAFPGYEWTSARARGGHHNVFFRGYGLERVPVQEAHYLTDLYLGLHTKHRPEDVLIIPHAHQAGDWRKNDVYLERLVEIMSMHGTFEWFGRKYLETGSQVGFVGASDDHLGHPGYSAGIARQQGGLAAVFSDSLTNGAVFAALRERQAYATSGDRIILHATLNGQDMGTRQDYSERRTIQGTVKGTSPIAAVDIIKNGEVIKSWDCLTVSRGDTGFLQLGFESNSEIFATRDNPRGYRRWRGSLEVRGAELRNVATPGFQDARTERAERDASNPNKVLFATATRGRLNNLVLELEGAGDDASIRILLEEGQESGAAPVRIRPAARIPSADLTFRLGDAETGRLVHKFQVGRYTDELSLTFINPSAPYDRDFSFTDTTEPGYGDYYYVRVRQLNGGLAWSSPFWVGGEAPR